MNLLEELKSVLKRDERLVSDDKLLKNRIVELGLKLDKDLIKLLLSNKRIKEHFFTEVDSTLVFDKEKFMKFIDNKEFLPDSYTAFKNKIGLTADKRYLAKSKEVVLSWPYKDCVLEGGQEKEDEKRKEIFHNEILAPDEIDRLLEPKVFTNFKRIDAKGEHEVSEIKPTDNLIIKGNNLLALHSLKKRFAGKVKLIYIDPPYNTGNDEFKYNDSFNHSTWLTFMKNRLEVAKDLLRGDGVIFVHCDDNEQAYLKVLMDEIFDRENFIEVITVVNNPRGRDYGGIANMHEFINAYSKSDCYALYRLVDENKEFPYRDELSGFEIRELRNRNTKFNDKNRPNLFYPFYLNPNKQDENGFYEISLDKKDGWIEVLPAKSQGIQTVWRWGKDKSKDNLNKNICGKGMKNGGYQIVEKYREKSRMARSVWWDKEVNSERGTLHLKELFSGKVFDNPKPEETLKRVIEMSTRSGDIVLDFFAGSGTTAATAMKMDRQFITCEQMNYIQPVTVERLKKVIGKKTSKGRLVESNTNFDEGGISKAVNWKGGGEFVYCKLKELNEEFILKIQKAKDTKELLAIWEEMKEHAFLSYKINPKKFDENAEEFKDLSLEDQKKFLIECLDKNNLYVNYSEIEDKQYNVSKEDIELNNKFYGRL